eukprot:7271748-Ditylum_brightwellii.AAC.1
MTNDGTDILRNPEDPCLLKPMIQDLKKTIVIWLDEIGPADRSASKYCSKDSRKAMKLNAMPWLARIIFITFIPLFFLIPKALLNLENWKKLFDPSSGHGAKAVWAIKLAIGSTALISMTIFWDAYKNWDLIIDDAPGSHFQAWVIIAFHFTTTQSTEGTVKKGLLRLLATLFAGLS